MTSAIELLQTELAEDLRNIRKGLTSEKVKQLKAKYLGKSGNISKIMRTVGKLKPEERPAFGKAVNRFRDTFNEAVITLLEELKQEKIQNAFSSSTIDASLPGRRLPYGSLHPLSLVRDDIITFFLNMGFEIAGGPEIETDWYNFEALNFPPDHPTRDMQDTFYIDDKVILRTQTSNVQIHVMEQRKPPIRVIAPGRVYRADSDASHAPMFHQVEGLVVDENISFAHLKGVLFLWARHMFGEKTRLRFRPSFFPFTEPSAEMDVTCTICGGEGCRVCGQTGWLEILGCGSVDPNVFENVGIDAEKYTGFAFGFGIDRICMTKLGIPEIGMLNSNDIRFLKQF